jgi:antibiotic biosynthesis monooxygenase (ABM) superfamily enzyme
VTEHHGAALAADETDPDHRPHPGLASVHVRALVTWLSIFPLAAGGMTVITLLIPSWPPALKALVLTAVVVPLSVYVLVPRLLHVTLTIRRRLSRRRRTDLIPRTPSVDGVTPASSAR